MTSQPPRLTPFIWTAPVFTAASRCSATCQTTGYSQATQAVLAYLMASVGRVFTVQPQLVKCPLSVLECPPMRNLHSTGVRQGFEAASASIDSKLRQPVSAVPG